MPRAAITGRFLGFVGHRHLADPIAVQEALSTVMSTYLRQPSAARPTLLTGFAEGADRIAVTLWRAAAGEVTYLFPYPDPETQNADPPTHAWTDKPDRSKANRVCFADSQIDPKDVIIMNPRSDGPSGHRLVAQALTEKADWLIAVWDGNIADPPRPGGTADVVAMMTQLGKPVHVVRADRGGSVTEP
jgi:hypothetical protein